MSKLTWISIGEDLEKSEVPPINLYRWIGDRKESFTRMGEATLYKEMKKWEKEHEFCKECTHFTECGDASPYAYLDPDCFEAKEDVK
jgi:hypothetical protein